MVREDMIKYIVKPEEGLVIGIYYGNERDDIWETIFSQLPMSEMFAVIELVCASGNKDYTIKAIAKCSEEDEFDPEYGKKLVEAKIYRKLHANAIRKIEKLMKNFDKISMRLQNERIRHEWKVSNIDKDLKEYFKIDKKG